MPDPSTSVNELAVPPVICQLRVADCPGATVLGEAVRLKVSGTVMVTVSGPAFAARSGGRDGVSGGESDGSAH